MNSPSNEGIPGKNFCITDVWANIQSIDKQETCTLFKQPIKSEMCSELFSWSFSPKIVSHVR